LTGLPNRAQFLKWLDAKLNLAKGSSVLVLLDLDRFKVVNDRFGHTAGDELLVAVAERLKRAIPTNAKLARLSGDEFTCLIEGNVTEAKAITQSMLDSLKQPIELRADLVNIRASAGLAQLDPTMRDSSSWLRRADAMLYQQKGLGVSGLMVYGEHMVTQLGLQSELEAEVEMAIAQRQFRFALQPIVSLKDGCTIGAEALVRWIHPKHGFIPPNDFIPSAERSGHVKGIDGCVVDLVRNWFERNDSERYISVNLSPASLSVLNDDTTLHCLAEEFGPKLRVEVTERAMIANFELAAAGLEHLRSRGVKVLLDDFGTGYSSLSYVHRLPVDALKIDQSFVARLGEDKRSESLIRMITALADSLSLDVIAEGIETEHQRDLLKSFNVEFGQGYLFGKPVLQA
jgi:diguanylate cyclase (GGDEF)-like protein